MQSPQFQSEISGLAMRACSTEGDFWSWRELMYSFANRVEPNYLHTILLSLYIESFKRGNTAASEYHYIHHSQPSRPYENIAEASKADIHAVCEIGIAIQRLPSFHYYDSFGEPALTSQKSPVDSVDSFELLFSELEIFVDLDFI